jgi:hypothetical protein
MPTRVKKNPDLSPILASSLLLFPGQQPIYRFTKLVADPQQNLRRSVGSSHRFQANRFTGELVRMAPQPNWSAEHIPTCQRISVRYLRA